ncbi:acetate/propionate family kinase [Thiothrix nivea]|uniref:Acetate kinase n=1 Tax=Thiothrix nivea (strain ATCC 35100 / DSM 5205 / JP2) TaxID=870187 RepID=A0A656HME7_THINJ|nr:acetate kinase [Thiothrix nivea]EIJ36489.1 acetate kinase [Thiothrix nivea DSM 5205]
MKVLVLNAGSSSIKYQVFAMADQQVLVKGLIDRIGEAGSEIASHHQSLERIIQHLQASGVTVDAIGHRVVHGGERFHQPAQIDADVIAAIRAMISLAPLHNPANLEGIEVAQRLFPDVPQVAVFDTAFHQTMPPVAFRYALPESLYREHKVRRYGFHGTSHRYVAQQAALYLQTGLADLNLITLHLGNGCSATAIAGGKSVDTSMGMTPLEGLVMGTRCGDIDPALHFYLQRETGLDSAALESLLNKHSGLKGVCGVSDMREIQQRAEKGDEAAQLAEAMFAYRVKKYIGAYLAVLGKVDAIVFTGGIGEHSARIRELVCRNLEGLGVEPDWVRNWLPTDGVLEFQQPDAPLRLLVVPTNEELEIARSTATLVLAPSAPTSPHSP